MRCVIYLIFLVFLPLYASSSWGVIVTPQHDSCLYDGNPVVESPKNYNYGVAQKLSGDRVRQTIGSLSDIVRGESFFAFVDGFFVTKGAAQIAREGGRHSGQLKQFLKRTPEQLQKSIRSFDKKVTQHEGGIKDSTSKVKNFNSLSKEHQGNLIHHWGQDISRAKELKSIAQDVLKGL